MGYEEWSIVQLRGCFDAAVFFPHVCITFYDYFVKKEESLQFVPFNFQLCQTIRFVFSIVREQKKEAYYRLPFNEMWRPLINFRISMKLVPKVHLFDELSFSCHFSLSLTFEDDWEKNRPNTIWLMTNHKQWPYECRVKIYRCIATDDRYERNWLNWTADRERRTWNPKFSHGNKRVTIDLIISIRTEDHFTKCNEMYGVQRKKEYDRDLSKSLRKRAQLGNVVVVYFFLLSFAWKVHQSIMFVRGKQSSIERSRSKANVNTDVQTCFSLSVAVSVSRSLYVCFCWNLVSVCFFLPFVSQHLSSGIECVNDANFFSEISM